jgi:ABC-type lipoprotein release transport system permease subunit
MIVKIAWRNIWRNKVRSAVVIIAVALGLWAGIFASAFVRGMMEQKIDSVIKLEMSHFQIHHPAFRDELHVSDTIANRENILSELKSKDSIVGVSERVIGMFMMTSPNYNGALKITGINPTQEASVTKLNQFVQEGTYLEPGRKNPILISHKTAEKYKINLRSKVVLTFQDIDGEITAGAFRVTGIYDSKNSMYDEMNAFVNINDIQRLLNIGSASHEIAVLLSEHDISEPFTQKYQEKWPEMEVLAWSDLSPGMRFFIEAKDTYTLVIVGIILVALLFSILNTMLMAVLERVREIGMLMAIGMTKIRVFKMIMLETIYLVMLGGPFGLLLSWLSINYFGTRGINLGNAAYQDVGFSNIVYPFLDAKSYLMVTLMVVAMALVAAIYPAQKALSLKPIEAIRKT